MQAAHGFSWFSSYPARFKSYIGHVPQQKLRIALCRRPVIWPSHILPIAQGFSLHEPFYFVAIFWAALQPCGLRGVARQRLFNPSLEWTYGN